MSVTLDDIREAAERLEGVAVRTPLIESPALEARLGGRVLIKPETLQRVGAFKFRGAYNRLSRLTEAERARGVVAFSSGNHAQGVALAGKALGVPVVVVMPLDAPRVKAEATANYGAEIRFYDRARESREEIAAAIAAERGAVVVPAFDDPHVIAGQGTVGLEIVEQAGALDERLAQVIGPVGGGGLMGGVSLAVKSQAPWALVFGVEPEGFDDTRLSLEAGERRGAPPHARSLCDALEAPMPGELTFPLLQAHLDGVRTVDDAEVAEAVRFAFRDLKLTVEPGGAVGLAALLSGKLEPTAAGATVLILSGGNVDPQLFGRLIAPPA